MDVQKVDADNGFATTPRARFVNDHRGTWIRISRTRELQEALAAAAECDVTRVTFDYRFYDDSYASCRMTYRRAAGHRDATKPVIEEACHRVRQLVEEAVLEALGEKLDFDQELELKVNLSFDSRAAEWSIDGSGNTFQLIEELSDISVSLD